MFSRVEPPSMALAAVSEIDRFSLKHLREIHKQLFDNKSVTQENEALVVEILRVLAEMVVYGDNKSEMLFDFFCEKNMLSLFLEIMWTEGGCHFRVHVQILQTLSILISCVKNETSLYYLLSNNYINEIIIYPHDFSRNDMDGLMDQFVSFLKTLSLRLNIKTVQFFFIERTGAFPLLNRAIDLLHSNEPMVRIAAQATILNVFQVRYVSMYSLIYVCVYVYIRIYTYLYICISGEVRLHVFTETSICAHIYMKYMYIYK
jgi:protein CLEC16A